MKIILVILSFLFVNFSTYANGHSGKIHLEGFGAWSLNIMNAGNGNLSVTYDGLYSGVAMNGTKFGNNSSVQCVGGLTASKGKFNDESGICKFLFANGDTAFTKYKGSGAIGKGGSATFEFIGALVNISQYLDQELSHEFKFKQQKKVLHKVKIHLREVLNLTRSLIKNFFK